MNVGTAAEPVLRYPVLAPVLILVGALMASSLADVPWRDPLVAVPAFLCVIVMPLSVSITEGLAWGVMARSALAIGSGRAREAPLGLHLLAAFFVARALVLG